MEVLARRWLAPRDLEGRANLPTEEPADLDAARSDANFSIRHELGPQQVRLPLMMRPRVGQVAEHLGGGTFDENRSRSNRHVSIDRGRSDGSPTDEPTPCSGFARPLERPSITAVLSARCVGGRRS
jgi:hypothetical protein